MGVMLLAAAVGCRREKAEEAAAPPPTPSHGGLELNLATFNIRNEENRDPGERSWSRRTQQAVRLLRKLGPDIIGMQELTHGQAADLWASLPDYGFSGRAREDGIRKGEYAGIFYRRQRFTEGGEGGTFWLSSTPDLPGSATWGNSFPRIATWARLVDRATGRGFYVYNTHFDHRHQGSREQAAVLIARRIDARRHPEEPVVLLGDFNAVAANPAVAYFTGAAGMVAGERRQWKKPLVETYLALHAAAKTPQTLHFWGTREGWKIDHILVSKGARVVESGVAPDILPFASDHYPVTARVVFP
jgi:endonuclease/exonuclease/phosphatase family metal-dependent hydrolase